MAKIIAITGPRQSGKTTKVAEILRAKGARTILHFGEHTPLGVMMPETKIIFKKHGVRFSKRQRYDAVVFDHLPSISSSLVLPETAAAWIIITFSHSSTDMLVPADEVIECKKSW